ncbi:MAG: hypothetical protein K9H62_24305 [Bacteroidales bacterium]|nr:hypothetical protein [Bacteroidales bacterium]
MTSSQPSIHVFDVRIDEPITMFTDLVVTAVCIYAWFRMSESHKSNHVNRYLRFYFLTMGIATALGGILGHGFQYAFDAWFPSSFVVSPWKLPGWLVSMFSITLLERAAIEYLRPIIKPKLGKLFTLINILELVVFIFITIYTINFYFVQIHAAYGLLFVVTSINLYVLYKRKTLSSKLFLMAVGISAVGALVFLNKWDIGIWFNHYDISHLLMALSAYVFYKASKQLLKDPIVNGRGK